MLEKPLIFLDIDGVLVNLWSLKRGRDSQGLHRADPLCVAQLNRLTDESGAQLVISSTWRLKGLPLVVDVLKSWGVTGKVVGATPDLTTVRGSKLLVAPSRGREISAWLDLTGDVGDRVAGVSFVILDDDGDMDDLLSRLVWTDTYRGLTSADVDRALEVLNGWKQN